VGPRPGLDAIEKRKILTLPGFEPQPSNSYPVAMPVAMPTELSRLLLRRILGVKREEVAQNWRALLMKNFTICTAYVFIRMIRSK
jgi:hypothetical protein